MTLDSVSISLQSYQLNDGTVWLLPIYDYSGTVMNSDGSSYRSDWTTIAVDPSYVDVNVTSGGGLNTGGPILY